MKTHFEEGDINEGLINKVVQLSGNYCSFGQASKWIEMVGLFFSNLWNGHPYN